jgi:hypothetical protein
MKEFTVIAINEKEHKMIVISSHQDKKEAEKTFFEAQENPEFKDCELGIAYDVQNLPPNVNYYKDLN